MAKQAATVQEEIKEEQKTSNVSDVTKNMVDVLSNSANPKHRNCKFLKFLNKLNHGAYTIENEQLVKHPEKIKEFRAIDLERKEKEILQQKTEVDEALDDGSTQINTMMQPN